MPDYFVSEQYMLVATFVGSDLVTPTDPSVVTFTKQAPDGTLTTVLQASLTHVSTGVWSYTTAETAPGTYTWEAKGTGAVSVRDLDRVRVKPGIT